MIENLETRRMLSVSLNAATKLLTITGTDKNDDILVSQTATQIKVTDNGINHVFAVGNVNKINVVAKDGTDVVRLDASVTKPSFIDSGLNTNGGEWFLKGRSERVYGGSGKDEIVMRSQEYASGFGNKGDDIITVYGYECVAEGGEGNDRLVAGNGKSNANIYEGGPGTDTMDYSKAQQRGIVVNGGNNAATLVSGSFDIGSLFDTYNAGRDMEKLVGTKFADNISGSDFVNEEILGGGGNDVIKGAGGNDIIRGGDGNDKLFGGVGSDALFGDAGDDYLQGDAGNDFLSGGIGKDALHGNDNNDTFYSKDGVSDFLAGGNGTDTAKAADRDAIDILNSIETT